MSILNFVLEYKLTLLLVFDEAEPPLPYGGTRRAQARESRIIAVGAREL